MEKGESVDSVRKHRSKKKKGSKEKGEKVAEKGVDLILEKAERESDGIPLNSSSELKMNAEQLALLQLEQEATMRSVARRTDSSRALIELETQYTSQQAQKQQQNIVSPRNNRSFFAVDTTKQEVPLATYQEGKLTRALTKMKTTNKARTSLTLNSSSESLSHNNSTALSSSGLNSSHTPHSTGQLMLQLTTWNCLSTDQEIEKSYVPDVKPHLRWKTGRKERFGQYLGPLASSFDPSARMQSNSNSSLPGVATAIYSLQEVTDGMVKVALKALSKHAPKQCSYDSVFRCRNKVLRDGCALLYDRYCID